jgi:TPR repeat protein
MIKWVTLTLTVVFSLSAPLYADLYSARAALRIGDYRLAMKELTPLADAGTADAQFLLAQIYSDGLGMAPDPALAIFWLQRAAEQGHARAQNNLGLLFEKGVGTQQDPVQAASWYRKAAEQGRPVAQNNLGRLLRDGSGVTPDPAAASRWFRSAATQGHAEAENNLGMLYEAGLGVDHDASAAAEWYRLAAKQGLAEAQNNLGLLYDHGDGVAEEPGLAAKWYRQAAEQGHLAAQKNLASLYTIGRGVKHNSRKARFWTLRAKELEADGSERLRGLATAPEGETLVADAPPEPMPPSQTPAPSTDGVFEEGLDLYAKGDTNASFNIWMPLAEQGDQRSQYRVGSLLRTGSGVLQDPFEALSWLEKAAVQGHKRAAYDLAFMYFRGHGVPHGRKDFVQAYLWFSIATEHGFGDAAAWRERVAAKLTADEIDAARQLFPQMMTSHAETPKLE